MCIKQGNINEDMEDVTFNNEILDEKLLWEERTFDNSQIQFHKK